MNVSPNGKRRKEAEKHAWSGKQRKIKEEVLQKPDSARNSSASEKRNDWRYNGY